MCEVSISGNSTWYMLTKLLTGVRAHPRYLTFRQQVDALAEQQFVRSLLLPESFFCVE